MESWQDSVSTLAGVEHWHPQTAYVGLQNPLQQEWVFVKRVTPDIGMKFQVVEDALRDIFLPYLFQRATAHILVREITGLTLKQAGIALPEPTWITGANWMAYCMITGHLVAVLCRTAQLRLDNHALLMGEGRYEIQQRHAKESENALQESQTAVSKPDTQQMGQIQRTGAWILVPPLTVNGTELGAQE